MRNSVAVFYAKGKEKTGFLANYLDRNVEHLDDLGCPRVENFYFQNHPNGIRLIPHNSRNLCVLMKSNVFFDWLKNEHKREISEREDIPTTNSMLCAWMTPEGDVS